MTIFRLARSSIAVALCLTASAALAEKLKWTEMTDPTEINDPKNAVSELLTAVWGRDMKTYDQANRAYEVMYTVAKVGGKQYLVSMLSGPNCSPSECSWYVQRISSAYRAEAASDRIDACRDRNTVKASNDGLSICGQAVQLP